MFTKSFWVDALERAVRTFAQAVLAVTTVDGATKDIQANWQGVLITALLAALTSVLMSLVASGTGNHDTAALVTPKTDR